MKKTEKFKKKVGYFAEDHETDILIAIPACIAGATGIAAGSFLLGWHAYIFVCDKIPYSYRTDNPILDLLGAVGIRDYADIDLSKED